MSLDEILNRREDQSLEFKSAEVLAKAPETVARAVAGMLNAEGGEIWIGVDEEDERPTAINPVAAPEQAKRRLEDYLVEVLDPAPLPGEVVIDLEPIQQDRAVLIVRIQPPEPPSPRVPFAFRKKGGWHFIRRIGARNHPMTREEVFGARVTGSADEADEADGTVETAVQSLVTARLEFRDLGQGGLWMGFRPARTLDLDTQAHRERFDQIAIDPTLTDNRRVGQHFAQSRHHAKLKKDGIRWEAWSDFFNAPSSSVEVKDDGTLLFWASLWTLHRGDEFEIGPWQMLEYPISAFRIARAILGEHLDAVDRVAVDLALFDIGRWRLREGTPHQGSFLFNEPVLQEESDLIWAPLVFAYREIDENPDGCGFRLVRRIYQAFGLPETAIPRQYDRETGRLLLPE